MDTAVLSDTVTLSPEFQLEVPLAIRDELGLAPGEKFLVRAFAGRVESIRIRPIPPITPASTS